MNKSAFITNGLNVYAQACITSLAKEGYAIAFGYDEKDNDKAVALVNKVESLGIECRKYSVDYSAKGEAEKITKIIVSDFGGIDLLICTTESAKKSLVNKTGKSVIDNTYRINYASIMMCTKVVANDLVEQNKGGSIIYITSTNGMRSYKDDFLGGSINAGLHRTIESLSLQLAPNNIRINCIAPGAVGEEVYSDLVATRLPLGRAGTYNDISNAVLMLANDNASYVTGITLKVDGGSSLAGMPEINEGYGWDKSQVFKI